MHVFAHNDFRKTFTHVLVHSVTELEGQVRSLTESRQAEQAHAKAKESQLCQAFEEERKLHEEILRDLKENHTKACEASNEAERKAVAVSEHADCHGCISFPVVSTASAYSRKRHMHVQASLTNTFHHDIHGYSAS